MKLKFVKTPLKAREIMKSEADWYMLKPEFGNAFRGAQFGEWFKANVDIIRQKLEVEAQMEAKRIKTIINIGRAGEKCQWCQQWIKQPYIEKHAARCKKRPA